MSKEKMEKIVRDLARISVECEKFSGEYGERAMKIIGEHPLYASTCGITYGQAIAIAILCGGSIDEQEKTDELMTEYFKTDRKHSLEDYDKWLAERSENDGKN